MLPSTASAQVPEEPTFAKDVAPIFYRSCVNCHRAGEIAPMSLITYQEARPWARSIRNKVESRAMPPWHLDRQLGIQGFKNDPSLTEAEVSTILKWVDNGAPQGNPADTPAPPQFAAADSWQIGDPDLVVKFPTYTVPAAGPDLFGNLLTDMGIDEDRYITAIQTRPVGDKSRQVVHHASLTPSSRTTRASRWAPACSSSSTRRESRRKSILPILVCCSRGTHKRD
jgi:hypothetical protein